MSVKYNGKHLAKFIRPEEYDTIFPQVELAHQQLESRSGAGNDFLGWLDLPVNYDKEEFARKQPKRSVKIPMCCWSPVSAALTWAHALLSKQSRVCITTIPRTA